ncbi:MAG: TetR/AcrR family transcriptional regulator [Roseibium sp.]
MSQTQKLSRTDWIKAAFRALSEGGSGAIRAEAIARDLKVSKGSFYWHFKDVPDLKATMLSHWRDQATGQIIEAVDAHSSDPAERLRFLVKIAAGDASEPYGGPVVEPVIREWSRSDTNAARTLKQVDGWRLDYLFGLFSQLYAGETEARQKARLLYAGLIGLELLVFQDKADLEIDLPALLEELLP